MNIEKLKIEIDLLRILKPIVYNIRESLPVIAQQVELIHRLKELNPDSENWKEFQSQTNNHLKNLRKISDEFEIRKKELILIYKKKHIEIKEGVLVKFYDKANVVIIHQESKYPEVI